ncbi:ABC transporter permease [Salinibacterium sp. SWN1162]|uniref:ABC transporter permease n=1 Tax=Salinibacterium sp. SWN1162 TaxID=2792053 RepID=UPI0018CF7DCB|nr:ABC transporter permease [Salinibacterium sp. SWN1162]MBH0008381.1 molybdate ABC transporter permease subunit [Salinibacterium sp. SWN1162]
MSAVSRTTATAGSGIPRLLYLPAALGFALLILPLVGLFLRADWPSVPAAIVSDEAQSALWLSLQTALAATVLCLIVGIPLALVIARSGNRLAGLLRALTTLPLVMPPLVGGIALLYLLGRNGLVGSVLELWFGIRIPFTTGAVVIAQSFVALPFLVISVEGALRTAGTRFELVAATLGAGRWTVFRRVTLPLIMPGVIAGTVLCFARALGEFGATALFAGNAAGTTRTMPLAIYTAFNGAGVSQDSAIALSLLLVVVGIVILLLLRSWRTTPEL